MKLVYIAGKFRGKSPWEVHQNVIAAERASLEVAQLGAMPVCPHKNTEHFDGLLTDKFWLDGTLEVMRRCDVVFVHNWQHAETSVGTKGEINEARVPTGRTWSGISLPVFDDLDDLEDWLLENP